MYRHQTFLVLDLSFRARLAWFVDRGGAYDMNTRFLLPTVMAVAMSLEMSLVDTMVRVGWAPGLVSTWLSSFAVGVVVAAPTAILIAPAAQRLVGRLTGGATETSGGN